MPPRRGLFSIRRKPRLDGPSAEAGWAEGERLVNVYYQGRRTRLVVSLSSAQSLTMAGTGLSSLQREQVIELSQAPYQRQAITVPS